jgi:hypothetical protein
MVKFWKEERKEREEGRKGRKESKGKEGWMDGGREQKRKVSKKVKKIN